MADIMLVGLDPTLERGLRTVLYRAISGPSDTREIYNVNDLENNIGENELAESDIWNNDVLCPYGAQTIKAYE